MATAPAPTAGTGILGLLPIGIPLSDRHWQQRHRIAAQPNLLALNATIGALAGRIQSETDTAMSSMAEVSAVIEWISGYTTTIAAAVEEQSATTALTRTTFADVAAGATSIADAVRELAARA